MLSIFLMSPVSWTLSKDKILWLKASDLWLLFVVKTCACSRRILPVMLEFERESSMVRLSGFSDKFLAPESILMFPDHVPTDPVTS